ncbi:hypothetical protein DPMN_038899 [Dreissena polymorpha]|uniref:Uncharacterized protein n=1 Tax=Dreissena polymorpha TaxID=45954 RepID=A0A9D4MF24_DREPO|nr:hypothetical protein DPMN_038899 [Dreissena polymorpha]
MDESMSSDRATPDNVWDFLPTASTTASVKTDSCAGFGPPPKRKYTHVSIRRKSDGEIVWSTISLK